jgi:hypothetical protein
MRSIIGLALAASILAVAPANAQTIDFRTVKCQEIAALPIETLDFVSVWLDGYSADEEDAESMKADFSGTDADEIKAYCQQHPDPAFLKAAEEMDKEK